MSLKVYRLENGWVANDGRSGMPFGPYRVAFDAGSGWFAHDYRVGIFGRTPFEALYRWNKLIATSGGK